MKKRGVKSTRTRTKSQRKSKAKKKPVSKTSKKTVRKPKRGMRKPVKKKAAKKKTTKKPAKRSPKTEKAKRPTHLIAVQEEQKLQKNIDKRVRLWLSPEELPVFLFVISLITLAILFNSISLIFYTVTTLLVVWAAHFFHKHKHRPHDSITILATFFLPAIATMVMYRDLLSWFLLFVYTLSAISTIIIYYYHHRQHSLLKIMWQVTYSKIMAITIGAVLVSLIPAILPETHVSISELMLIYLFPIVLVVFFLSKFLYIYYFEHKHIRHDIWISIRYSVIYALTFMILMLAIYSLFAVQIYNVNQADMTKKMDAALLDSTKIDKILEKQPEETKNLAIYKDLKTFNEEVIKEISDAKNDILENQLSFGSIMDDTYLDQISKNSQASEHIRTKIRSEIEAKAFLTGRQQLLQKAVDMNASMPDGSKTLAEYSENLKVKIEDKYLVYKLEMPMSGLIEAIEDPTTSADFFEDNGVNWFFAQKQGIRAIYHSESMFMQQVMETMRYTYPFRVMSIKNMKDFLFYDKERFAGHLEQEMYEKQRTESDMSRALRYELIMQKADEAPMLLEFEVSQE